MLLITLVREVAWILYCQSLTNARGVKVQNVKDVIGESSLVGDTSLPPVESSILS